MTANWVFLFAVVFITACVSSLLTYVLTKTRLESQLKKVLAEQPKPPPQPQSPPTPQPPQQHQQPNEDLPQQPQPPRCSEETHESQSRASEPQTAEYQSFRSMAVQSQCTYSFVRKDKSAKKNYAFEHLRRGEDGAFPGL